MTKKVLTPEQEKEIQMMFDVVTLCMYIEIELLKDKKTKTTTLDKIQIRNDEMYNKVKLYHNQKEIGKVKNIYNNICKELKYNWDTIRVLRYNYKGELKLYKDVVDRVKFCIERKCINTENQFHDVDMMIQIKRDEEAVNTQFFKSMIELCNLYYNEYYEKNSFGLLTKNPTLINIPQKINNIPTSFLTFENNKIITSTKSNVNSNAASFKKYRSYGIYKDQYVYNKEFDTLGFKAGDLIQFKLQNNLYLYGQVLLNGVAFFEYTTKTTKYNLVKLIQSNFKVIFTKIYKPQDRLYFEAESYMVFKSVEVIGNSDIPEYSLRTLYGFNSLRFTDDYKEEVVHLDVEINDLLLKAKLIENNITISNVSQFRYLLIHLEDIFVLKLSVFASWYKDCDKLINPIACDVPIINDVKILIDEAKKEVGWYGKIEKSKELLLDPKTSVFTVQYFDYYFQDHANNRNKNSLMYWLTGILLTGGCDEEVYKILVAFKHFLGVDYIARSNKKYLKLFFNENFTWEKFKIFENLTRLGAYCLSQREDSYILDQYPRAKLSLDLTKTSEWFDFNQLLPNDRILKDGMFDAIDITKIDFEAESTYLKYIPHIYAHLQKYNLIHKSVKLK
jgi:hypothetical protein